jgi:hypothetical protein
VHLADALSERWVAVDGKTETLLVDRRIGKGEDSVESKEHDTSGDDKQGDADLVTFHLSLRVVDQTTL